MTSCIHENEDIDHFQYYQRKQSCYAAAESRINSVFKSQITVTVVFEKKSDVLTSLKKKT
jgi:hypothetical protein